MPTTVETAEFAQIDEQWEEVLPVSITNNVFVTPWWQRIWWEHFGTDSQLRIFVVRNGDRLLGIAPMRLREGVLSFLGDTDLFDYHDFVVLRDSEEVFYETLCDYLAGTDWHTMHLGSLPEGSPTLRYMRKMSDGNGISVTVSDEDKAPVAKLPSSWDEYLAGLRRHDRHELRRKLRRLERADGARQYTCNSIGVLADSMADFFRLLRSSSPDKATFLTGARERFFMDVASEMASRGHLRLCFLEVGGHRVASCICFDYDGAYLLYNSGYDPEYASLSVGLLNKALCIREAIERGRMRFEFLRGSERYKYNLGAVDRVVSRMVVRRDSTS